jgi:hypothetical protein
VPLLLPSCGLLSALPFCLKEGTPGTGTKRGWGSRVLLPHTQSRHEDLTQLGRWTQRWPWQECSWQNKPTRIGTQATCTMEPPHSGPLLSQEPSEQGSWAVFPQPGAASSWGGRCGCFPACGSSRFLGTAQVEAPGPPALDGVCVGLLWPQGKVSQTVAKNHGIWLSCLRSDVRYLKVPGSSGGSGKDPACLFQLHWPGAPWPVATSL